MCDEDVTMKELQTTLDQLDNENKVLDAKIESLKNKKEDIEQQKILILTQMQSLVKSQTKNKNSRNCNVNHNSKSNTSTYNDLRLVQFQGKFTWDKTVEHSLKKKFKLNTFRPMQREIINCTLKQKDCFIILPSGGGKSLCYQLPAILPQPYTNKGITLVVSPLVSLMIDQCYQLTKIGIKAGSLHGTDNSRIEHKQIYDDLSSLDDGETDPEFKLIYVTPEKVVKSKKLHNKLEIAYNNNRFDRIVIDEAHCCSQWGHDFRTSYKNLNLLRRQYKDVPILACTATATDEVLNDTMKILRMKNAMIFRGSFNRPNLHYSVRPKPSTKKDAFSELLSIVKDEYNGESGIVYVLTRKMCVEIFQHLKENGVAALPYHGDMDNEFRAKTQTKWLEDKCQVVVATLAFGLGINKPDVSFVVHYTISKSIQNYYQESGRAGRDGKPSNCILLYKPSDCFSHIGPLISTTNEPQKLLKPIMEYAHNMNKCRRHIMAKSFNEGDTITTAVCNQTCDVCDNSNSDEYKIKDITQDAILINKIVQKTVNKNKKNTLSMSQLVDVWRGTSSSAPGKRLISDLNINKMKTSTFSKAECEYIIGELFIMGYFNIDTRFTAYQAVCVIVPGPRSFTLTELYWKRNNVRVGINLPILGKRKRNALESARKNGRKRAKSAIHSNSNMNTNNRMNENHYNLSSQSQDDFQPILMNNKLIKSEPNHNKKRGRKRKREIMNLCSDSDNERDESSEDNVIMEEVNDVRKKLRKKKVSSTWDFSDDDEFDFEFHEDCSKKKKDKKKKKWKKKRLSDTDDDVQEIEAPKKKKRKLSKKANRKKKGKEKDENEKLEVVDDYDIDAVPDRYKDNSLEYKMYTELHIWNQLKGKLLLNGMIQEILDNLPHVLSEEQLELERIIGANYWTKCGRELLKEIRRVRTEYDQYNKKMNNMNEVIDDDCNVIGNNNNKNKSNLNGKDVMHNNDNNFYKRDMGQNKNGMNNNNMNGSNQYSNDNYQENTNMGNGNGNNRMFDNNNNSKAIVVTPMKIADNLRNRNNKVPPKISSSFCAASLVNNDKININDRPRLPRQRQRQRRNSAPSKNGIKINENVKKKRDVSMIQNSTLHQKLLPPSIITGNNNNSKNMNNNGFEYPDSSDNDISSPYSSTESPLLIKQRQQNKRSISSRSNKLKLNFQ